MATLQAQLQKAQKANKGELVKAIFVYLNEIKAQLVELNKKQLNEDSQGITGDPLGFYSRATEIITTQEALLGRNVRIKKAGEPFDLEQTGTFLKNLYAEPSINKAIVAFGSSDPKTDEILENPSLLTKELFGLTETNLNIIIRDFILPFYLKNNRQILDL